MNEISDTLERMVRKGLIAELAIDPTPGRKSTVVISADGDKKLFDAGAGRQPTPSRRLARAPPPVVASPGLGRRWGFPMGRAAQLLVLLALSGCKCPGGTVADGGVTAGSIATYADFCATQVDVWCAKLVECKTVAAAARADCAGYLGRFCASLDASLERGYRTYHVDVAASCLAAFRAETNCDALSSFFGPSCDGVLTPASPAGGACLAEGDCTAKGEHCVGANCALRCTPQGGLGQGCEYGTTCHDGLWCDPAKVCRAPQAPGGACQGKVYQCDDTSYCDRAQGRCVARPLAGQPCGPDVFDPCATDAWCDNTTRLCRPRATLGQPCTPVSCVAGTYCDRAAAQPTCKAVLADGASCTASWQCASAFGLCDPLLFVCEQLGARAATGQPCTTFHACDNFGDGCKGQLANPDGGRGTAGTCLPKSLGDSCVGSYDCPKASYCDGADGGAGRCRAAGLGTPCRSDSECAADAYCAATACAARGNAGSPCELARASCSGALQCRPTAAGAATGACAAPGLGGDPCAATAGYRQCSLPFECAGSTCAEHGRLGEPCLQVFFGTCIAGSCAGGSSCAAFAADGEACHSGLDCSSASCPAGTCEALCR